MTFWIRHLTLVILCVVVPLGAALYVDTESEIVRAKRGGATAARLGERSLSQTLRLDAHQTVGSARLLARKIAEESLLEDAVRGGQTKKKAALENLALLVEANGRNGFAWIVDGAGKIVFANGMTDIAESPRSIVGHPLFARTQQGFALDGFWEEGGKIAHVGAAPITKDGRAEGAVLIARTLDVALLRGLASASGGELTMVSGSQVVASTVDDALAKSIVAMTQGSVEPVHGGRLAQPLASGMLPFLPVLIDPHADGLAFTSYVHTSPLNNVRFIVSVPSAQPLQELARRQEVLLAVFAAALMLALLVGLLNHRTFVSPIELVAEHLSAIQLGRGEAELNEARVSRPFRRMVRLVNMLVQKLPTRGFATTASLIDSSPISELPAPSITNDLHSPPIMPPPVAITPRPAVKPRVEEPEEEDAVGDAIAAMSLPPVRPSEMDDYGQEEDSAAAIAEAIASLEAQQKATDPSLTAPPQASSGPRSAANIRGGTPAVESPSPFAPSQSEYFRAGTVTSTRPSGQQKFYMPPEEAVTQGAGAGLRGGGSVAGLGRAALADDDAFNGSQQTAVAPVQKELLAKSARDGEDDEAKGPDSTVVASVPADLLAQSAGESIPDSPTSGEAGDQGLDAADHAHFKQVYERFIEMRRKCGEPTADLAFDRFLIKLTKNRENLMKKYSCRTVRFQVYEKDGKAALKATPVRAR
jgi:hypothetical protein